MTMEYRLLECLKYSYNLCLEMEYRPQECLRHSQDCIMLKIDLLFVVNREQSMLEINKSCPMGGRKYKAPQ